MSKYGIVTAAGLLTALSALVAAPAPSTEPIFQHGLELRVRHVGEADFSAQTKKLGVEFYRDGEGGNGLYIDETGNTAALAAKLVAPDAAENKAPDWSHAMELDVRKAGEKDFTKETHKYAIEVFVDANNGNYLYIGEAGALAVVPSKLGVAKVGKEVKPPVWKNAMELRVRKAGEADFNDKTKKIGVEVYLDANNGNIVYLSETGSIAVLPAALAKMDETKRAPDWLYGLEMDAQGRRVGVQQGNQALRRGGLPRRFRRGGAVHRRDRRHCGRPRELERNAGDGRQGERAGVEAGDGPRLP